jgi:cell division protein FtsB
MTKEKNKNIAAFVAGVIIGKKTVRPITHILYILLILLVLLFSSGGPVYTYISNLNIEKISALEKSNSKLQLSIEDKNNQIRNLKKKAYNNQKDYRKDLITLRDTCFSYTSFLPVACKGKFLELGLVEEN